MFGKKYWHMREKVIGDQTREIFKCTGCGAVSAPEKGWGGEPDVHQCHAGCSCQNGDWRPGTHTDNYRKNFDAIFPDSPGAGV